MTIPQSAPPRRVSCARALHPMTLTRPTETPLTKAAKSRAKCGDYAGARHQMEGWLAEEGDRPRGPSRGGLAGGRSAECGDRGLGVRPAVMCWLGGDGGPQKDACKSRLRGMLASQMCSKTTDQDAWCPDHEKHQNIPSKNRATYARERPVSDDRRAPPRPRSRRPCRRTEPDTDPVSGFPSAQFLVRWLNKRLHQVQR